MASKSCSTCVYAEPIKGSSWVSCHRYPPTGLINTPNGFPNAPLDGWCGEYKVQPVKVQLTEAL